VRTPLRGEQPGQEGAGRDEGVRRGERGAFGHARLARAVAPLARQRVQEPGDPGSRLPRHVHGVRPRGEPQAVEHDHARLGREAVDERGVRDVIDDAPVVQVAAREQVLGGRLRDHEVEKRHGMMPRMPRSLSIVMAAFDEEDALPACVDRTLAFLRAHIPDGELIIVDDGSKDGTPALIDRLAREHAEIVALHLERNSGMGAALLRGFAAARKDWVTIMPADGQIDAFELLDFFAAAEREGADLVTSLYRNRQYSPARWALSLGLRALTTAIVGTRARTEGIYLVRRAVLERLGARSQSFLLNLEIPIRAKRGGFRVETIQMNVHERIAGASKATSAARIRQTFVELFRLRVQMERERVESLLERLRSLR
jgi:dolichol-phosphate mannosyltransferase